MMTQSPQLSKLMHFPYCEDNFPLVIRNQHFCASQGPFLKVTLQGRDPAGTQNVGFLWLMWCHPGPGQGWAGGEAAQGAAVGGGTPIPHASYRSVASNQGPQFQICADHYCCHTMLQRTCCPPDLPTADTKMHVHLPSNHKKASDWPCRGSAHSMPTMGSWNKGAKDGHKMVHPFYGMH